ERLAARLALQARGAEADQGVLRAVAAGKALHRAVGVFAAHDTVLAQPLQQHAPVESAGGGARLRARDGSDHPAGLAQIGHAVAAGRPGLGRGKFWFHGDRLVAGSSCSRRSHLRAGRPKRVSMFSARAASTDGAAIAVFFIAVTMLLPSLVGE